MSGVCMAGARQEPPLLQLEGLCVSTAAAKPVVHDVSLSLHRGEPLGIAGESGCGKTTAVLAPGRLLPDGLRMSGGRILFDGRDMCALSDTEFRRILGRDMGYVFQNPLSSLNPVMTVYRQIAERLVLFSTCTAQEIRERVRSALRSVGLPDTKFFYNQYPHQLSGGMRQRVMIAGAIINEPKLIIADEPTTALDPSVQKSILSLLTGICNKSGAALLLVSHNLSVLASCCSRIAVMYAGKIVETGSTQQVLENPLHPYTRGLIRCVPSFRHRGGALPALSGIPERCCADARCGFANRCPDADSACFAQAAELREITDGHCCRCIRASSQRAQEKAGI